MGVSTVVVKLQLGSKIDNFWKLNLELRNFNLTAKLEVKLEILKGSKIRSIIGALKL